MGIFCCGCSNGTRCAYLNLQRQTNQKEHIEKVNYIMKKRSARIYYVSFLIVILGFVLYLFVKTFNDNLLYYRSPTQLVNGNFPENYIFRIGGMVEEGSLVRVSGTKKVSFNVTDFDNKVLVKYDGILPDLFREGQGVVIRGRIESDYFIAEEVLAKHDETYMPPEIQETLGISEDSKNKTMESIEQ